MLVRVWARRRDGSYGVDDPDRGDGQPLDAAAAGLHPGAAAVAAAGGVYFHVSGYRLREAAGLREDPGACAGDCGGGGQERAVAGVRGDFGEDWGRGEEDPGVGRGGALGLH